MGRSRPITGPVGVSASALCVLAVLVACGDGGEGESARSDRRPCAATVAGWQPLRPALLRRTEVGAARIGRFIFVVGGFLPSRETTAAVERYDIREDRWRRAAPLPIAVNHPAVAALGGRLYVFGGYTDSSFGAVTGRLQRFDPRTGRWRLLPAAPTARAAAGLGAVGARLYAVGGAAAGGALPVVEAYDTAQRRWSRVVPLAIAREHLAVTAADGFLYALGGRAKGVNLRTVERYRPGTDSWRRAPSLLVARSGFAAATIGNRIGVFGGEQLRPGGHTIRAAELLGGGVWRRLPGMRTPRHGLGGAAFDGRIYALEGGPEPGFAFSSRLEALEVSPERRCGSA